MEKKDVTPSAYLRYEHQMELRAKRLAEITNLDTAPTMCEFICTAVGTQSNHVAIYEEGFDRTNKI